MLLRVSSYEIVDASAQPIAVGTCRHAREGRAVEFALRGFCERCRCPPRPFESAAARDDSMEPHHLARKAALARPCQKVAHPGAVRAIGMSKGIGEQKRPFALPEIAADLLAITRDVSGEGVRNVNVN